MNYASLFKKSCGLILLIFFISSGLYGQEITLLQRKAKRYAVKKDRFERSNSDGAYLLLQGGFRREGRAYADFDQFSNLSGLLTGNVGWRRQNFSFETGVKFIYHSPDRNFYIPSLGEEIGISLDLNSMAIPVVVKYEIPVGEKQQFKFGANFSANYLNTSFNDRSQSFGGGSLSGDPENTFKYVATSNSKRSDFFFNAGIHGEMRFLNSSFLIASISRAFVLGPNRTYTVDWTTENQSGSFLIESRIQSFIFEIGYRLPFAVLAKN